MDNVKRWSVVRNTNAFGQLVSSSIAIDSKGLFVSHDDYNDLIMELERLKEENKEIRNKYKRGFIDLRSEMKNVINSFSDHSSF